MSTELIYDFTGGQLARVLKPWEPTMGEIRQRVRKPENFGELPALHYIIESFEVWDGHDWIDKTKEILVV